MKCRRRGGYDGRGPIIRPPFTDTPQQHQASKQQHQASSQQQHQTSQPQKQASSQQHHTSQQASQLQNEASSQQLQTSQQQQQTSQQQTRQQQQINQQPDDALNQNNQHREENHNVENRTTPSVSDDYGNPEASLVLDPNGLWFHHRKVVDIVVETSYKTYFKGPYYNWSKTPDEAKDRWWNAFKQECRWDSSIASLVKKSWQSKCARRLSGIVSKVCKDRTYVAEWCAPTIREEMIKGRSIDEFLEKSSQCSKNRLSNSCQKVHHRQGSISTEEVKLKLEKKLGRKPTAAEVYFDGHTDNDGQFVNAKAQEVWNEFEKRKSTNNECDDETRKSEDQVFYEATGGWNEKGRVFGLGAAADSYFTRPSYEEKNGKKSRSDYIKGLEAQVTDLVVENVQQKKELDDLVAENILQRKELEETKEGLVQNQRNLLITQKALIETQGTLGATTTSLKILEKQVQILMQAARHDDRS